MVSQTRAERENPGLEIEKVGTVLKNSTLFYLICTCAFANLIQHRAYSRIIWLTFYPKDWGLHCTPSHPSNISSTPLSCSVVMTCMPANFLSKPSLSQAMLCILQTWLRLKYVLTNLVALVTCLVICTFGGLQGRQWD